jgi:hypothetical protein
VAEGGGLLNRYRVVKPYRGFESLRLRQNRLINNLVFRHSCAQTDVQFVSARLSDAGGARMISFFTAISVFLLLMIAFGVTAIPRRRE